MIGTYAQQHAGIGARHVSYAGLPHSFSPLPTSMATAEIFLTGLVAAAMPDNTLFESAVKE